MSDYSYAIRCSVHLPAGNSAQGNRLFKDFLSTINESERLIKSIDKGFSLQIEKEFGKKRFELSVDPSSTFYATDELVESNTDFDGIVYGALAKLAYGLGKIPDSFFYLGFTSGIYDFDSEYALVFYKRAEDEKIFYSATNSDDLDDFSGMPTSVAIDSLEVDLSFGNGLFEEGEDEPSRSFMQDQYYIEEQFEEMLDENGCLYEDDPKDVDFDAGRTSVSSSSKKASMLKQASSPVRLDPVPSTKTDSSAEGSLAIDENGLAIFGKYPQAIVLDKSLVRKLKAVGVPSGLETIEYEGQHYARVNKSYAANRWFLVQPIKWRILYKESGRALLLADRSLDARKFDTKTAYYPDSSLRKWLNKEFLEFAFTSKEKKQILCVDGDFVSLLSKKDLTNPAYGMCSASDCLADPTPFANIRGVGAYGGGSNYWTKDTSLGGYAVECVWDRRDYEKLSLKDPFTIDKPNSFWVKVRPCIWVKL